MRSASLAFRMRWGCCRRGMFVGVVGAVVRIGGFLEVEGMGADGESGCFHGVAFKKKK